MKYKITTFFICGAVLMSSCAQKGTEKKDTVPEDSTQTTVKPEEKNKYWTEKFADIRIHRYFVKSWDELTDKQKELLYYLSEAANSGRDIVFHQNFKHNLLVRKTLEEIITNYEGDREDENWKAFETYTRRVMVASGIHHHYSEMKFKPGFDEAYFDLLISNSEEANWPLYENQLEEEYLALLKKILFDENYAPKRTNKTGDDIVQTSAVSFYGEDVTQAEVEAFYNEMRDSTDKTPVEYGHNSTLVRENGQLVEKTWKLNGMYHEAIQRIVHWLEKAVTVAENDAQQTALQKLVDFYKSGDLEDWDAYNVAWVKDTSSVVDVINGFIEVYRDPMGYKATFESVVSIKDFDASRRMQAVSRYAQYFEDNSPIMDEHKKTEVKGISYKVIEAVMEGGDCNPTTPIGINLPNSQWIREQHGSKSVSLGNIIHAYDQASGSGILNEFAHDDEEIKRAKEYGVLASKMHTALHEVIGHASGKMREGVSGGALKNYYSTLEEARADLVALYYLMDPKLVEIGLVPNLELAKAEYDGYIRNGLMTQLRRIEEGENIEEDHMRNRQLVAKWVFENGKADSVIVQIEKNGKTYFDIRDYDKLRELFGALLREVQRIKSNGDFAAGKKLVEDYGVMVDTELHEEVLQRVAPLNLPPYGAFINPRIEAETDDDGNVVAVSIGYPEDFLEQHLRYGKEYAFLIPGKE